MTTITNDQVIEIHYTLKLDSGETIDSSIGRNPLAYIHGKKNIIPGLEKELSGKKVGDSFKVIIPPHEAYGEIDPNLIQVVPKNKFEDGDDLAIGMQFRAPTENGNMTIVKIVGISGDQVTLDGNHPLAGMNLHFDVRVESIRQASKDEITHGHLHKGAGCCGGGEGGCGNSCDDDDHCSE